MIILLPWSFFNMGDGSTPVIDIPGLEYTLQENRLHFTMPEGRLHYTFTEEDG